MNEKKKVLIATTIIAGILFVVVFFNIVTQPRIRTDTEPIYNHFKNFPHAKTVIWGSYSLYPEIDPGPNAYGVEIIAILGSSEFEDFAKTVKIEAMLVVKEGRAFSSRVFPRQWIRGLEWYRVSDGKDYIYEDKREGMRVQELLVNFEYKLIYVYAE